MERQQLGFAQRWRELRLKKTAVFWSCVASAIFTMVIGFSWGGWVTESTARSMAEQTGDSAVVKRLAPICLVRFEQDPERARKLKVVKDTDTWQRGDYVKKQGWATMPGEREADGKVADECVKLLMLSQQ